MKTFSIAVQFITVALIYALALPKAIGLSLVYYLDSLALHARFGEGPPTDLKALHEATEKALAKISQDVKEMGAKALAEAKKHGDMYALDKPKVDEMLVKQGELQAQLLEVEQKLARRGTEEKDAPKSIGGQLVSDDAFKAWVESDGMRTHNSSYVHRFNATLLSDQQTQQSTIGVSPDMQPGIVIQPNQRLTIRDLITPGRTSSNLIAYLRETGFTNSAATVSEGTVKPASDIAYEQVQSAVVTIAHYIKATKQILDDFMQLQSQIDGRLRYGLKLVEETQLLKGSGSGNNLNGIYTAATTYVAPTTVPNPSKIDQFRLMLLQAELAEYPATGIVMHPIDWTEIELKKDTLGRYIIGNPVGMINPTLWARPVVATKSMTRDTGLVGAFRLGAQLFDREDANVVIATMNEDDFIRNLITIRCEERLALAVYRPEAFIKSTNLVGS